MANGSCGAGRSTVKLILWRMPVDGSGEEQQITFTKGEQEGGAFYLPDSETMCCFRSWDISSQGQRGMPMTIYTINHDGSDKNRSPRKRAPTGRHIRHPMVNTLPM